jgi:type IV pilus assembly protein PilO
VNFTLRELIFVVVLLAMPISSYWFVFKPRNEQIEQARKEIEHKELLLEKLRAATDQSADLARENATIAEEIEHVQSRLPSDKEVDVILRQVAELATQNNLKLDRVRAGRAITATSYMEQPLEMFITGNFDNFYNFLLELEQLKCKPSSRSASTSNPQASPRRSGANNESAHTRNERLLR